MTTVGEFTASNISMDVDARDEKKPGTVDLVKLAADVQAQRDLAAKVGVGGRAVELQRRIRPERGCCTGLACNGPGCFAAPHTPLHARSRTHTQTRAQGQLHAALEGLLGLEKTSRLAEDITATKACCTAILDLCYQAKDWKLLEEQVLVLTKRRSQLKQASSVL